MIYEIIRDDDQPLMRGAGLHFFLFFIDQDVYRDDDAEGMDSLFDVELDGERELKELVGQLKSYWERRIGQERPTEKT
jgi:hypothetical protein